MNKEWAQEKLRAYIAAVRSYKAILDNNDFDQQAYEEVMKLELAAKPIMRRVKPDFEDFDFIHGASMTALTQAVQTLALLDEAEELERNLSSDGPQLDAKNLHPWVWDAAKELWETNHYREAVQASATSINAHLQELASRRDVSDYRLINELFSEKPPEFGKPRLRWPGAATDESVRSMQQGIRNFGAGIFQGIRNTASHDLAEIKEQVALEQLASMSIFCRWIDNCEPIFKRRLKIGEV